MTPVNPAAPGLAPERAPRTMVYTVDLGNGQVADIEGPEGATPEQLQAVIAGQGGGNEVGPDMEGGFAGDLAPQVRSTLSPEDEGQLQNLYRTGNVSDIQRFLQSRGRTSDAAQLATYVANRDKGAPTSTTPTYDFPQVADDGSLAAGTRGVADTLMAGTLPKVGAAIAAGEAALTGGDAGQAYDQTLDLNNATIGSDEQNHQWARISGQLAGGALLPMGLTGIAARAETAAIAAGKSLEEAHAIGQAALRSQIVKASAGYGAAHGAGSADTIGEAATGALTEGAAGALAGKVLPLIGDGIGAITRPITRTIGGGVRAITAPFTREGALDRASSVLRNAADDPEAAAAAIAARDAPVAGVEPTLAEVADSRGLAGLQQGIANTNPTTAGPAINARHAENALARTRAASGAMGEGSPLAMQDLATREAASGQAATAEQQALRAAAVDNRLTGLREGASASERGAHANLRSAVDALAPAADRDVTGADARRAFETAHEAAKVKTRAAFADPALQKPQPIAIPKSVFSNVTQRADDFYGDGGGDIPAALSRILDDMKAPGTTTRTLTNINRRLADFAGEARMAGRGKEAAFAEGVRHDLLDFTNRAAPTPYRDALAAANAARAEQGRLFEYGDVADTFARGQFNRPNYEDVRIPGRLLRQGAAGGATAEGLIRSVGPDVAERAVRQELRRVVEEGGIDTAAKARAIATRYGEAAQRFPSVQRDLTNLEARAADLEGARSGVSVADRAKPTPAEAAAVKENAAAHDAFLASPLSKLADTNTDPASFVKGMLGRDDNGIQLRAFIRSVEGNEDAKSGLRRALGQYIENARATETFTAAGEQVPSPTYTRRAIATVLSRAKGALTDQQAIVLRQVGKELEKVSFAHRAARPSGSDTASNAVVASLVGKLHIGVTGRLVIGKVLSALDNTNQVKELLTQAILDPDFAATLLKRPTERHLQQAAAAMAKRGNGRATLAVSSAANDNIPLHDILLSALRGSKSSVAAQGEPDDKSAVGNRQ